MRGLVQAVIIAHTALKEYLQRFGYDPEPINPGSWRHNNNGIKFTLVVDDFGIKYKRKEGAMNLIHTLQ